MTPSNGPLLFTAAPADEPTCMHGITQTAQGQCECPCKASAAFGRAQDTGSGGVLLYDGEFRYQVIDLSIPGRGFDWRFERIYRSGIVFDGPMGRNWEFNYNRRLFIADNGDIRRMDGYGRADFVFSHAFPPFLPSSAKCFET